MGFDIQLTVNDSLDNGVTVILSSGLDGNPDMEIIWITQSTWMLHTYLYTTSLLAHATFVHTYMQTSAGRYQENDDDTVTIHHNIKLYILY